MAKYFMAWNVDTSRVPEDNKERAVTWSGMLELVKQQIKEGKLKDWGNFVGETRGYAVSEQSEIEVIRTLQNYYPFIDFEVHQVMTADEMLEALKPMTE